VLLMGGWFGRLGPSGCLPLRGRFSRRILIRRSMDAGRLMIKMIKSEKVHGEAD
jgi:hypothetical protein